LKHSSTLLNLFCRTARVLAGSVALCLRLAREGALGPAAEVACGNEGPFEDNSSNRETKLSLTTV